MATKVLNIELGERICKVCVSEQKRKRFQISSSFLMETPQGAVQDGYVSDIANLSSALKSELATHHQHGIKLVNFTLTSTRVVSREVNLPPIKDNRIASAIASNAADYFPVDISSYIVSHCVLEKLSGEVPGLRVQVVAAPKALIEGYYAFAESLEMKLGCVDYCGNSQYQLLRSIENQDVVCYVDVNDKNTFVSFISNGILHLQRNIGAGAGELIEDLMSANNEKSYLETLRKSSDRAYLNQALTEDSISYGLSRVVGGVSRSVDYFISSHQEMKVSKVVLMGTCSRIAGLKEAVAKAVDIETVLLEDIEGIKFMANSAENVSDYINCIGALVAPLDLYSEEMFGQKKSGKKSGGTESTMASSILLCTLCIVAGLTLSAFAAMKYKDALNEQIRLENRIQELSYVMDVYNTYLGYDATAANLEMIEASSETPTSELRAFFEELEYKMPSGMLILSAVADNSGIVMNLSTTGLEEADVVLSQLRSFESISNMVVSTITETVSEEGITLATFSVNCGFKQPGAEDASAAQ